MSNELTGSRYDNFIRRIGNLQGPGSKLTEIVPSAMPVLPVEGAPFELQALAGWSSYFHGTSVTAGVATSGYVVLQNPTGSNILCVCNRIYARSNSNGDFQSITLRNQNTAHTPVWTTGMTRDGRSNARSACTVGAFTGAASGATGQISVGSAYDRILSQPFVILPGWELLFEQVTNSALVHCVFSYSERSLEASEHER